jgi:hypothetical protein
MMMVMAPPDISASAHHAKTPTPGRVLTPSYLGIFLSPQCRGAIAQVSFPDVYKVANSESPSTIQLIRILPELPLSSPSLIVHRYLH